MRAAGELEQIGLFLILYTLRNNLKAGRLGHQYHSLSHHQCIDALAHFRTDRSVQLQAVEPELTQISNARIPRAEIIKDELNAPRLQSVDHRAQYRTVEQNFGFSHLDLQPSGFDRKPLQSPVHHPKEFHGPHLQCRNIDAETQIPVGAGHSTALFEQVFAQFIDKTVLLSDLDEFLGRYDDTIGALPAGEDFHCNRLQITGIDDRLAYDAKFTIFDALADLLRHFHTLFHSGIDVVAINRNIAAAAALGLVHREIRAAQQFFTGDVLKAGRCQADACLYLETVGPHAKRFRRKSNCCSGKLMGA